MRLFRNTKEILNNETRQQIIFDSDCIFYMRHLYAKKRLKKKKRNEKKGNFHIL